MSQEYPDFPDPRKPKPSPDLDGTYFHDQSPPESSDQTKTQKIYTQLHHSYNQFTKKEQMIQFTGMLFILLSFVIEFIVYLQVKKILPYIRPDLIWKLSFIFIILFVITLLALGQFVIIYRWNNSVDHTAASGSSLTLVNYRMVDRVRTMIALVIIILFFCLIYFSLYNQYRLPNPDQVGVLFRRLVITYRFFLRVSWVIITGYFVLEIWQLIRWIRRNSAVRRLEQKIIQEIPNIDELANITEFADNSQRF